MSHGVEANLGAAEADGGGWHDAPPGHFLDAAERSLAAGCTSEAVRILDLGCKRHPAHRELMLRAATLQVSASLAALAPIVAAEPDSDALEALFAAAAATRDPAVVEALLTGLWPGGQAPALARAMAGRQLRRLRSRGAARRLLVEAACEDGMPDWVAREAQGAAWAHTIPSFEPGPAALDEAVARFGRAITSILSGDVALPPAARLPVRFTPHLLALYWVKSRCRVLDAGSLAPEDEALLREKVGIHPQFLAIAARDPETVGEACFARFPELPFAAMQDVPLRVRDAAAATQLGGKPALCPFTAGRAVLRDNIAPDIFLHRGGSQPCLVLTPPAWAKPLQDAAWFFPAEGILLFAHGAQRQFGDPEGFLRHFAEALAMLYHARRAFAAYLADGKRQVAVMQLTTGHIGHDLWNGISAWPRFLSLVPPGSADLIVVDRALDTYGTPAELYPEHSVFAGRQVDGGRELLRRVILPNRAVMVSLRDLYIPQDLANRVLAVARSRCSPEALARVSALRAACDPLLLLTLRLENRMWQEQEDGYIALVRRLAEDFPRLGVVLDGMNAGNDKFSTHGRMSLDAERAMAARIVEGVGDRATVYDSIGCPISESLMLCEAVDAYAAPIGAGMAKSRWVTNKPGVAFSNDVMLEPGHFDGSLYDNPKFREAPCPAVFVDAADVVNLGKGRYTRPFRANFSMRWEVIHAKLVPLLSAICDAGRRPG